MRKGFLSVLKKVLAMALAYGLWLYPITYVVLRILFAKVPISLVDAELKREICMYASVIPVFMYVFRKKSKPSPEGSVFERERFKRPDVHEDMLFKIPNGVVFGKMKRKYVCKPVDMDGHIAVIGGSGSGKSSCFAIPTIMAASQDEACRIFALDIKGELHTKCFTKDSPNVFVFDPQDRKASYGWNPFYRLSGESTRQEVLETMMEISHSLIPMPGDVKDPFWKESARSLFIGLMLHFYGSGIDSFVKIVDQILSRPITETISDVRRSGNKDALEYRYLSQFFNMPDETLGGIIAEMNNHILIFSVDQDIRYAFGRKHCISPQAVEEGHTFISIKEDKLTSYNDVLRLIINQTLSFLERRSENSETQILFMIDELARIVSSGKLERLMDGARTLRSRHVTLILITQSLEALYISYSENEVTDLISNCPYILVLSASSSKTQKSIIDWCGKYKQTRQSWSGSGLETRVTTSFEDKDIVEASDLVSLPKTGEVILISTHGYNRILKTPYFRDQYFKAISDEINSCSNAED